MIGISQLLLTHLQFMKWADGIYFEMLSQLPAGKADEDAGISFQSYTGTLQHIYKAEIIWFRRMQNDVYPKLGDISVPDHLPEWQELWNGLHHAWIEWAKTLEEERWEEVILHRFSSGGEMQIPRWQVVLHLVNHGSYHRGQLASLLRQAGIRPPATDLAAFYRTR
jgi:uncharacterized damage-inducible protein DinB